MPATIAPPERSYKRSSKYVDPEQVDELVKLAKKDWATDEKVYESEEDARKVAHAYRRFMRNPEEGGDPELKVRTRVWQNEQGWVFAITSKEA